VIAAGAELDQGGGKPHGAELVMVGDQVDTSRAGACMRCRRVSWRRVARSTAVAM
jgi:hypothetical protein